jgi:predicted heme/steroid binding protein
MEEYVSISPEDLAKRNGRVLPEIWIAYKGFIYDVTSSPLFEGGKHYKHESGQDLTKEMEKAPHMDDVMEKFQIVGVLKA